MLGAQEPRDGVRVDAASRLVASEAWSDKGYREVPKMSLDQAAEWVNTKVAEWMLHKTA